MNVSRRYKRQTTAAQEETTESKILSPFSQLNGRRLASHASKTISAPSAPHTDTLLMLHHKAMGRVTSNCSDCFSLLKKKGTQKAARPIKVNPNAYSFCVALGESLTRAERPGHKHGLPHCQAPKCPRRCSQQQESGSEHSGLWEKMSLVTVKFLLILDAGGNWYLGSSSLSLLRSRRQ